MYARVSTAQVQPGRIDEYLSMVEGMKPEFNKIPGVVTYYQLMDRETHKGISIGIYESEAAATAASSKMQELGGRVAHLLVLETVSREYFEVSLTR